MSRKKHVLIFGGAFNPPTLAHEAIMRACLALQLFDEVWVMPSGERLDKQMAASDSDRLRMLELVRAQRFENDPRLRISDFELRLPRPTKTIATVQALTAAYPDYVFWYAYGAESYASMPLWPGGDQLRQLLHNVVIFARGDTPFPASRNSIKLTLPPEVAPISSTAVRNALLSDQPLDSYVSQGVADYIVRHGLYKGGH